MVSVKIYIEGGGDSKELRSRCREGFRKLLEKMDLQRMPRLVACGGRNAAYDAFSTAVSQSDAGYSMLLVDSEDPVRGSSPWTHLHSRDGRARPDCVADEQAQLMVTCMETWIMADRQALHRFFGAGLREHALLPENDLESRVRDDVQQALEDATQACGRGRGYCKGRRAYQMLAELNPATLKRLLPYFRRFADELGRLLK